MTQPLLVTDPGAKELPPNSGAKASNLQRLFQQGFAVPATIFIPPAAYGTFVRHAGLALRIDSLTGSLRDGMRWEEIWDVSLELRNTFLRQPFPENLASSILGAVEAHLPSGPLAVRSCSPDEDSGFSHAGMHDSILDVRSDGELLRAISAVWAGP